MEQRRLSASLERLDPVDRAVLELSKRRGMTDGEIADMMRSTPAAVTRRRRQAVDRIAVWMGAADADDRRAVDLGLDRLLSADGAASSTPSGAATRQPGAGPAPRASTGATAEEPPSARGAWVVALVVIALAVLGAVLGIWLSTAGQEGAKGPGAPVATSPGAAPAPAGPAPGPTRTARLAPLSAAGERASAVVRVRPRAAGRRLELQVRRLPGGGGRYGLWLFNTQADAVALASFRRVPANPSVPLPDQAARYRYIDISAEPSDGNDNHSGRSLLRVPTAQLLSTS